VDSYQPGKTIPSCQIGLDCTHEIEPPEKLSYRISILGVTSHTCITITRTPTNIPITKEPGQSQALALTLTLWKGAGTMILFVSLHHPACFDLYHPAHFVVYVCYVYMCVLSVCSVYNLTTDPWKSRMGKDMTVWYGTSFQGKTRSCDWCLLIQSSGSEVGHGHVNIWIQRAPPQPSAHSWSCPARQM